MKIVEAPEEYAPEEDDITLFLAGGISNCPNWQKEALSLLRGDNLVVFNPRRENYIHTDEAAEAQIRWEWSHIFFSDIFIFWFPEETVCPITLFEYGKCITSNKLIIAGCHPNYSRKLDLEIQTSLERRYDSIYTDLNEMCSIINRYISILSSK